MTKQDAQVVVTEGIVDIPLYHWRLQTVQQYGAGMIPYIIAREALQNSRDADASHVWLEVHNDGSWTFWDDGHGMTSDEFRKFYLTLGGTKKRTGSVGGYGAAKKVLSFSRLHWQAKGQGFEVKGKGAQWEMSAGEGLGIRKGFLLGGDGDDMETGDLVKGLKKVWMLSNISGIRECRVRAPRFLGDNPDAPGHLEPGWTNFSKGRPLLDNQVAKEWDWGTLYVVKNGTPNEFEASGRCYVRSAGLYSFDFRVGTDYIWYLELNADTTRDILSESRNSLQKEYDDLVSDQIERLKLQGVKVTEKQKTLTFYEPPGQTELFGKVGLRYEPSELYDREAEALLDILGLEDISQIGDGNSIRVTEQQVRALQDSDVPITLKSSTYSEPAPSQQDESLDQLPDEMDMGDKRDSLKTQLERKALWKEPVAMAHYSGPEPKLFTNSGNPRPKHCKALEVWAVAVEAVAEALGEDRPMLGLVFDPKPQDNTPTLAAHGKYGEWWTDQQYHVLVVDPDHALDSPAYAVLNSAEHEFCHYNRLYHSDGFVADMSGIKKKVGEKAVEILQAIAEAQEAPARQGYYWKDED